MIFGCFSEIKVRLEGFFCANKGMHEKLKWALDQPDIEEVMVDAVEDADRTMRKYVWRGIKPRYQKPDQELIVGDKSAKDFVNEALIRLCMGTRTYNPEKSLRDNLKAITDSLIWSDKMSCDRTHIVDFCIPADESGFLADPLTITPTTELSAAELLVEKERCDYERKCVDVIRATFDGDRETQDYLDALSEGIFDIDEITELTGIPASKIYEIRRKLKKVVPRYLGVTNIAELERKL